jgi:hypothetical protein
MKTYFTDTQDYSGATVAKLTAIEPSLAQGQGSTLAVTGLSVNGYTVDVDSKTGNTFIITEAAGVATRTCTTTGKAGCPSSGSW